MKSLPGRDFSILKLSEKNQRQLSKIPVVAGPPIQLIHSPQSQLFARHLHNGSGLLTKCNQLGIEKHTIVATVVIRTNNTAVTTKQEAIIDMFDFKTE